MELVGWLGGARVQCLEVVKLWGSKCGLSVGGQGGLFSLGARAVHPPCPPPLPHWVYIHSSIPLTLTPSPRPSVPLSYCPPLISAQPSQYPLSPHPNQPQINSHHSSHLSTQTIEIDSGAQGIQSDTTISMK